VLPPRTPPFLLIAQPSSQIFADQSGQDLSRRTFLLSNLRCEISCRACRTPLYLLALKSHTPPPPPPHLSRPPVGPLPSTLHIHVPNSSTARAHPSIGSIFPPHLSKSSTGRFPFSHFLLVLLPHPLTPQLSILSPRFSYPIRRHAALPP